MEKQIQSLQQQIVKENAGQDDATTKQKTVALLQKEIELLQMEIAQKQAEQKQSAGQAKAGGNSVSNNPKAASAPSAAARDSSGTGASPANPGDVVGEATWSAAGSFNALA